LTRLPQKEQRIRWRRMMLEGSDRPLKAVAFDCGFGSADRMRIVFSTRLGVTPVQHRASFRRVELDWIASYPTTRPLSSATAKVPTGLCRETTYGCPDP
jgi:hypothetical protein